jgi:hypothetical protein
MKVGSYSTDVMGFAEKNYDGSGRELTVQYMREEQRRNCSHPRL